MAPPENNDSSSDSSVGIPTPGSTEPNTPQNEPQSHETSTSASQISDNSNTAASTEELSTAAASPASEENPGTTQTDATTPNPNVSGDTPSDSASTEPITETADNASEDASTPGQPTEATPEATPETTPQASTPDADATTNPDSKTDEEKKEGESEDKTESIVIPSWFLEHEVHLFETGHTTPSRIRLVDLETGAPKTKDLTAAISQPSSDDKSKPSYGVTDESKSDSSTPIIYDVAEEFYAEAQDVTLWGLRSPDSEINQKFWNEAGAVLIQSPKSEHLDFLDGVVRHLAHDAGADLIVLNREAEMEDLCREVFGQKPDDVKKLIEESDGLEWYKKYFESTDDDKIKDCERLLDEVLKAADRKREGAEAAEDESAATPRPLILHIRDVESYSDEAPFKKFYSAVKRARENGKLVLIAATATSNSTPVYRQRTGAMDRVWDGLQLKGYSLADLHPRLTAEQSKALENRDNDAETHKSWRKFRRALRYILEPGLVSDAVFPPRYNDAASLDTIKKAFEIWETEADGIVGLAHRLSRQLNMHIKSKPHLEPRDVLALMEKTTKLKAAMKRCEDGKFTAPAATSDATPDTEPEKKSKVKDLIEKIRGDCTSHEEKFLDCVVDTDNITATRDSIRVDPTTLTSLSQLLRMKTKTHYGLLASESINGAILYGPPGTGKTHLARIMAKECGTTLLVATPADIQNCYVGETEKRIKAMFSLAAKLAPCTIFIDEGDSIFKARAQGDKDWTRKAMSQFLSEMDGLNKRKGAPFLFIATNRPGDLDDAVCRRLPHAIHVGLPNAEDRKAIFGIYLKEEKVAEDVNVAELAERTKGFSGSDVRTLCVQAALAAERDVEEAAMKREQEKESKKTEAEGEKKDEEGATEEKEEEEELKRMITKAHFEAALAVTRPTVTREALLEIQKFAALQKKPR